MDICYHHGCATDRTGEVRHPIGHEMSPFPRNLYFNNGNNNNSHHILNTEPKQLKYVDPGGAGGYMDQFNHFKSPYFPPTSTTTTTSSYPIYTPLKQKEIPSFDTHNNASSIPNYTRDFPNTSSHKNGDNGINQEMLINYHQASLSKQNSAISQNSSQQNQQSASDGDFNASIGDKIAQRYFIKSLLGKGSFGQVFKAFDASTNSLVAIKIIKNKKAFYEQGKFELQLLKIINKRDIFGKYVVLCLNHFTFCNHLCLVFELLYINLYELLKRGGFKGLPLSCVKMISRQIIDVLSFLKTLGIIHCDLKPENILLIDDKTYQVKVADMGSSCFSNNKPYKYIQSRFYRSPEVILELEYDHPIDMWSLGCVMMELVTGEALFRGSNEMDQLSCMMEVLGPIPSVLLQNSPKTQKFFDFDPILERYSLQSSNLIKAFRPFFSRTLSMILRKASHMQMMNDECILFENLVSLMLNYHHGLRMDPENAVYHMFYKSQQCVDTVNFCASSIPQISFPDTNCNDSGYLLTKPPSYSHAILHPTPMMSIPCQPGIREATGLNAPEGSGNKRIQKHSTPKRACPTFNFQSNCHFAEPPTLVSSNSNVAKWVKNGLVYRNHAKPCKKNEQSLCSQNALSVSSLPLCKNGSYIRTNDQHLKTCCYPHCNCSENAVVSQKSQLLQSLKCHRPLIDFLSKEYGHSYNKEYQTNSAYAVPPGGGGYAQDTSLFQMNTNCPKYCYSENISSSYRQGEIR